VIQVSGEYQNPVVTLLGGVDLAIVAYFVWNCCSSCSMWLF